MKNRILILISFIALLGCLPSAARANVYPVLVIDTIFSPDTLPTVSIGDTIRWKWVSGNNTTTSIGVPTGAATWNAPINSHDTVFQYVVTVAGTYHFRSEIDTSVQGIFEVTGFSGIGSPAIPQNALNLYPNPVNSSTTLLYQSFETGEGVVRIYDFTGKEVFQQQTAIVTGVNTLVLPVAHLQSGMYMAELTIGNEQIGVRRLIKD